MSYSNINNIMETSTSPLFLTKNINCIGVYMIFLYVYIYYIL